MRWHIVIQKKSELLTTSPMVQLVIFFINELSVDFLTENRIN